MFPGLVGGPTCEKAPPSEPIASSHNTLVCFKTKAAGKAYQNQPPRRWRHKPQVPVLTPYTPLRSRTAPPASPALGTSGHENPPRRRLQEDKAPRTALPGEETAGTAPPRRPPPLVSAPGRAALFPDPKCPFSACPKKWPSGRRCWGSPLPRGCSQVGGGAPAPCIWGGELRPPLVPTGDGTGIATAGQVPPGGRGDPPVSGSRQGGILWALSWEGLPCGPGFR